MKRLLLFFCILSMLWMPLSAYAEEKSKNEQKSEAVYQLKTDPFEVDAKSAVLMEASTGTVLFAQNAAEALPPASVTKVMTLLLVMEALDNGNFTLTDRVSVSKNAASMGGSQVFLEEGERMTVEDLLKCTVIASANDAALALAEYVAGSESAFVARMNERASQLGLTSTHFENVTGLDDTVTRHETSAADIAVMTKELLSHPTILNYSSLWQDTIRGGAFTLTNTNRLVRFYDGCNGMKTGSTDKAGYCVSVTATRDGMTLIAVVMGAESRDSRNAIARTLLDYGFSGFGVYTSEERKIETVPVLGGTEDAVGLYCKPFSAVVGKGDVRKVEVVYDIPATLTAPTEQGQAVGKMTFYLNGEVLGSADLYADASVGKISFFRIFMRYIENMLTGTQSSRYSR